MWKEIKKGIVVGVASAVAVKVTIFIIDKVTNLFKQSDDFKNEFDMDLDFSEGEYNYGHE